MIMGGIVFVSGFFAPLLIPFVMQLSLSSEWKTFLAGFLALGVPEFFMLIAISIMGKEGFQFLKTKLWRMIEPPATVGPLRYYFGLLLLLIPILFIWLWPYVESSQLWMLENRIALSLISMALVMTSLIILGGDFWDKLRGLFIYDTRAIQPSGQTSNITPDNVVIVPDLPISRLILGGFLFLLSLFLPVFIPFLKHIPVNDEWLSLLGGLMVFGIPQVFMFLAITVLGKPGFAYLKQCMSGWFSKLMPSRPSHNRYRLGIVLFTIPLLAGILWPYIISVFDAVANYRLVIAIGGDLMIVVALIVLGGDFWKKLTSLFNHQCRV
jgi:hypothetical protein